MMPNVEVIYCKNCINYQKCDICGLRHCSLYHGLRYAKDDDFCSFASTEENEDAGYDYDYQGVCCKDCAWYDGYLEECVFQNDKSYCGLLDPQPWDYCSRAEKRSEKNGK